MNVIPTQAIDRLMFNVPARYMRVEFTLDGQIDVSRLKHAIEVVTEAVPLLQSTLKETFWSASWRLDSRSRPPLPFSFLVKQQDHDSTTPPQRLKGAPFHVSLRRGDTDCVEIDFDHVAGDFQSLLQFAEHIATTYRLMSNVPGYRPAFITPPDRTVRPYVQSLSREERRRIRRDGWRYFREAARMGRWRLSKTEKSLLLNAPAVEQLTLPAHDLGRLESFGLSRGATAFMVLIATFYLATIQDLPSSDEFLPVMIPVDMRSRLRRSAEFDVSNQVGFELLGMHRSSTASFDSTLEAIRSQLIQRRFVLGETLSELFLECLPAPVRWWLSKTPLAWQRWRHRVHDRQRKNAGILAGLCVNHLGRLDPQRFHFGDCGVLSIRLPPTPNVLWRALNVYEFQNSWQIILEGNSRERLQQVSRTMMSLLHSAITP